MPTHREGATVVYILHFFHVRQNVSATWTFPPEAARDAARRSQILHLICSLGSPAGLHTACNTFMGTDKLSIVTHIRGINIALHVAISHPFHLSLQTGFFPSHQSVCPAKLYR